MMSPSLVTRDGRPRLAVGSAGSLRLRSAVLQVIVNVLGHGLGVREALEHPRIHVDAPHLHLEGGIAPAQVDLLAGMGYEVVRWRRKNLFFGGAAAVELLPDGKLAAAGDPRRGGDADRRRGLSDGIVVRPARPQDAPALVELARAVGAEPDGWLLSTDDWRDAAAERRLLRTLRRHPDAQVFVAESAEGVVGRLSVGRDTHPASHHVADLGLMVAASHRRRAGRLLLLQAVEWAREAGVRKLELHVFPHAPAIGLYETFGFMRGLPQGALPPRRRVRRRRADGARSRRFVSAAFTNVANCGKCDVPAKSEVRNLRGARP